MPQLTNLETKWTHTAEANWIEEKNVEKVARESHRAETTGAVKEGQPQPKKEAKEKKRPHSEKVREGNNESSRDTLSATATPSRPILGQKQENRMPRNCKKNLGSGRRPSGERNSQQNCDPKDAASTGREALQAHQRSTRGSGTEETRSRRCE